MYEIASLFLASVAAQARLNLTWLETPEDTFSHDGAQLLLVHFITTARPLPDELSILSYSSLH